MTLGDVISKYRAEHGISMDKFAELSGISKAYISILERNRNALDYEYNSIPGITSDTTPKEA